MMLSFVPLSQVNSNKNCFHTFILGQVILRLSYFYPRYMTYIVCEICRKNKEIMLKRSLKRFQNVYYITFQSHITSKFIFYNIIEIRRIAIKELTLLTLQDS